MPVAVGYARRGRRAMKDLDYYRDLPYHAVWEHVATADGDRYWQVHLREIPSVAGMGSTENDALDELRERFEEYVRFRLDEGLQIPEPEDAAPSDPPHAAAEEHHGRGGAGDARRPGGGQGQAAGTP
jgi:predicted RNase H-like HicB family nuclease